MKLYFGEPSIGGRIGPLLKTLPPLNFETFAAVSNAYLEGVNARACEASSYKGPVNIYFGELDPLLNVTKESAEWQSVFPQAKITYVKKDRALHAHRIGFIIRTRRALIFYF